MSISNEIIAKQNEIEKIKSEVTDIENQINEEKKEIIPILVVDIIAKLKKDAKDFFISSNTEMDQKEVNILKDEIEKTAEKIKNKLVEELTNSKEWDLNKGKSKTEDHHFLDNETDLSKNIGLWRIIRKVPKQIDDIFKSYNFKPLDRYKYILDPHRGISPYGLSLDNIYDIYEKLKRDNTPEKIGEMIKRYWKSISNYLSKIYELKQSEEELKRLKRKEMWEG